MSAKNGKPCRKCGTREWYKDGHCVVCAKERSRQWEQENRKRVNERGRRRYAANPESHRRAASRWAAANPENNRERNRRWQQANPEKNRENLRRWQQANPEKANARTHRYRTRKTEAGGSYTAAEWKALCKQYDNRCACCGKKKPLTFDHVIPVSKGGSSNISNGQPLCKPCNSSKKDKIVDYRTKPGIKRWIQKKLFS